jgi:hypothetical protein
MMDNDSTLMQIISAIAILIIIYYIISSIYNYYKNMSIIVSDPNPGTRQFVVQSGSPEKTTIPTIQEGKGITYSISTWIYINPINGTINNNPNRIIMLRGGFILSIDIVKNELKLKIPLHDNRSHTITYKNFPVQKWVNIVIVVNNRLVDLWLNGKLYKSKRFNNLILNNQNSSLFISPNGGFNGTIGRTYYYKKSLIRSEIVDIFDNGPYSTNFLSKLWDRIKIFIFAKLADTQVSNTTNVKK